MYISINQFRVGGSKAIHSPFSTIYFTGSNINLDITVNIECSKCKSSFFRGQRA
ncbi:hypothetical protein Hanom_Chr12g01172261 [Helianthus anomalus]